MAMEKRHRDIIRQNIVQLANNIDFNKVSIHLISEEIFDQSHVAAFEVRFRFTTVNIKENVCENINSEYAM